MDAERDPTPLDIANVEAAHRLRLAQAENSAVNGRLFAVMVFAACAIGYMHADKLAFQNGFGRLMILSAVPVGLACILDRMRDGWIKSFLAKACYSLAAIVAVFAYILIGE